MGFCGNAPPGRLYGSPRPCLEWRMWFRNTEWKPYYVPFWRPVTLIDGTPNVCRDVMRRKVNGEWQYRALSEAEAADVYSSEAW